MNAREGMQRLRDERRAYNLCSGCGAKLEKEYPRRNCPECLARYRIRDAKKRAKRKAERQ